jgi:hypothetical protein
MEKGGGGSCPAAASGEEREEKEWNNLCEVLNVILSNHIISSPLQSVPTKFHWFSEHVSLRLKNKSVPTGDLPFC